MFKKCLYAFPSMNIQSSMVNMTLCISEACDAKHNHCVQTFSELLNSLGCILYHSHLGFTFDSSFTLSDFFLIPKGYQIVSQRTQSIQIKRRRRSQGEDLIISFSDPKKNPSPSPQQQHHQSRKKKKKNHSTLTRKFLCISFHLSLKTYLLFTTVLD